MKRHERNSRTFSLFLISYSVVFVLPLLLFFYTYHESMAAMRENAQRIGLAALESCRESLEDQIDRMEDSAYQLSRNQSVLDYAGQPGPYVNRRTACQIRELQSSIDAFQTRLGEYASFFLYFPCSDVVLSSSGSHLCLERFYGDFFSLENTSLEEFRGMLEKSYFHASLPARAFSAQEEFSSNQNPRFRDGLLLLHSFPYVGSAPKGQIGFFVSAGQIVSNMAPVLDQWDGAVFILDEDGSLLFATDSQAAQTLPETGEEMLAIRSESSHRGWTYVMNVPQKAIYRDLQGPRLLLGLYACFVVLLGIGMVFYLSWRNSRWIGGISQVVSRWMEEEKKPVAQPENEFEAVRRSIQDLYQDRCELKRSLERQLPLMRTTFVEQLLKGSPFSRAELDWYLRELNFQGLQGDLAVVQVHLDLSGKPQDDGWVDRISLMKRLCEKAFGAVFASDVYYYDDSFALRTMILGLGELSREEAENRLESAAAQCRRELCGQFQVRVRFTAGRFASTLSEISRAYEEACLCMSAGFSERDREIFWPGDLDQCSAAYVYPVQTEMRLVHATSRGGGISARSVLEESLEEVFRQNFQLRQISAEAQGGLFAEMKGTLAKLLSALPDTAAREQRERMEKRVLAFQQGPEPRSWFEEFKAILTEFSALFSQESARQDAGPIREIRRYVEENFRNAQLNLNDVADHFNLTPPYLSQLFKEQMGVNFSAYLEDLRIRAACAHLKEKMPVHQVAEQVGYNSVTVFRSAFKRKMGVPPSSYAQK